MLTPPRSLARSLLLALAVLSGLVTLLLLIVTLALPGWLSGRGAELATAALGRQVSIGAAQVQPWRLALVLDDVAVAGAAAGQAPLLRLGRLDAALSLRSLLRGRVVVESLTVTRPELRLARVAQGQYDVDDLIKRLAAAPTGAEAEPQPAEFAVYNIQLLDGRVLFDDRPVARRHELADLHLALPYLSTLPADVQVTLQPHLSGKLDGVAFDSSAEALPFADDARARLAFTLQGLDLAPLGAYVPASAALRLQRGHLDVDLALDFAEQARQAPSVKLSGRLTLRDLALTQPGGRPLLALRQVDLPLADVQPLRRQLRFGAIRVESPDLRLPAAQPAPPASAPPAPPGPPWQVALAGLQVTDGKLTPADDLVLEDVQLQLGPVAWPLKAPAQGDASLRLDRATLRTQLRLAPELLQVDADLAGLQTERLARWLPLPAGVHLTATVSAHAGLTVKDPLGQAAAARAQIGIDDLALTQVRLGIGGGGTMASVASVRLDKARIDLAARSAELGTLGIDALRAELERDANGQLNLDRLLPGESGAEGAELGTAPTPGWTVQLGGLLMQRSGLRWHDAAAARSMPPVALAVEPLRVQLGPVSWPARAPVAAQVTAQLAALGANGQPVAASAGRLEWNGRLGLAPLSARGCLQAQALPLHLMRAYVDPAWGVQLQRADLGLAADLQASRRPDGGWEAALGGDVRLGPLALAQVRTIDGQPVAGEDLLSWQLLQLEGLRLAMAPGAPLQVALKAAQLDDAYARLIVDEQGRFNLRDLRPVAATQAARPESAAAPAPASAAASSAPPAPASPAPGVTWAADSLRINRGVVDFTDRFVRPHYSARLSDLQGSLGAFSSTSLDMAPLTVRGRVAGTGLLEIDGQLKPGAPLAMDVQARATDIELAPLSGYAGKYAGYAIERGKLSARMHYQVEPGGQLVASNQLILNQLTFGDRVDSPDATSLPVRFAVALLKDRDGVIDINLPVAGSLNDPEFSVGGLVWKLLLNLIGKALTSPFSLFTGGDATEASQVVFAPASAELPGGDALERVARLLADKPGVALTLTGWADAESEIPAIREQRLAQALKAENAATPEAALKRLYQATRLPNKPRNLLGLAKDLPPAEMRGLLMASYEVDDEALRQLAVARAVAVRDALLARGAPNARVFLGAPKLCNGACETGWRPHVELTLGSH